MIDESVIVKDGETRVNYPFIKDPNVLSDNRLQMIKRAEGLERSLKRRGLTKEYNEEFQKYIDRKVIAEVSKEELESYSGPTNFISHHGVLQPWKVTTPLRLVSNSSQDNRGHSLNSCLPKGPKCLGDMYKLLIKFRSYETGLIFDLSKAYHTYRTGPTEKYL